MRKNEKTGRMIEERMSEVLNDLSLYFLDMDATNKSADMEYTDEDCMNALIIFNSIASNRAVHKMQDTSVGPPFSLELAQQFGSDLGRVFQSMTGIDPKKYLAKK